MIVIIIIYLTLVIIGGEKVYSARLYKAVVGIKVTAVFCVCPEDHTNTKVYYLDPPTSGFGLSNHMWVPMWKDSY